jgi:hypothetical protein
MSSSSAAAFESGLHFRPCVPEKFRSEKGFGPQAEAAILQALEGI